MSLTKCPSCGSDVSTEAAACPKCGHPLAAKPSGGVNMSDPVHVIGVVLAIAILVVFVGGLIYAIMTQ